MNARARFLLALGAILLPSIAVSQGRTWLERAGKDQRSMRLVNPYAGQADAVKAGEKLYHHHCASCHGADAMGIGRNPRLRSPAVANAAPGALYWLLRNGSLGRGMPSWSSLPPEQRWQIVTWVKSLDRH